jgi:hypothetical protein
MGDRRGAYRVLVGGPSGKRLLERPRHRWDYNIKMNLQEVGSGDVDWIAVAQDRARLRKRTQKSADLISFAAEA